MNNSLATRISDASDARQAVEPPSPFSRDLTYPARNPGDSRDEFKSSAARVLPDPAICRASGYGISDIAECLVEGPLECPHVIHLFDHGCFCLHPERDEIVLRTSSLGC